MTEPSVEQIAAGLSHRQVELLRSEFRIGSKNPRGAPIALCELGLANCIIQGDDEAERYSLTLTPLGMSVRAHLISSGQSDDA